jgi:hypothetical protein
MYIGPKSGYTYYEPGGGQCHTRGWFLILMQPILGGKEPGGFIVDGRLKGGREPIKAVLRQVALRQCGHYMMGCARIGNQTVTVSGAYGNDGLITSVPPDAYSMGVELPQELVDAWGSDTTGWNSAGESGKLISKWALGNWRELVPEYKRRDRRL